MMKFLDDAIKALLDFNETCWKEDYYIYILAGCIILLLLLIKNFMFG